MAGGLRIDEDSDGPGHHCTFWCAYATIQSVGNCALVRLRLSQLASAVREPETSGCDPLVFAFMGVRALLDDQVILETPCVLRACLRSHLP
jgi:hypothetical protein